MGLGSRVGGLLRRRAYLIVYFLVLKVFKFFFAIGLWVSALCSECQRIEIRASAGIRGSNCDSVFLAIYVNIYICIYRRFAYIYIHLSIDLYIYMCAQILGGSWVVISRVISRVSVHIIHIIGVL